MKYDWCLKKSQWLFIICHFEKWLLITVADLLVKKITVYCWIEESSGRSGKRVLSVSKSERKLGFSFYRLLFTCWLYNILLSGEAQDSSLEQASQIRTADLCSLKLWFTKSEVKQAWRDHWLKRVLHHLLYQFVKWKMMNEGRLALVLRLYIVGKTSRGRHLPCGRGNPRRASSDLEVLWLPKDRFCIIH